MRLALISDIHGNLTALDAVLGEIASEAIDRVACLGDVAADGPQPGEVLQRLKALRCPMVMGNADAEVLGLIPVPDEPDMRMVAEAARWCSAQLGSDDLAFMARFEPRVELVMEGRALLLFHGAPNDFHTRLPPSLSDDALRQALSSFPADILAGGHTHMQMARWLDGSLLFNPGSVGMAYDWRRNDKVELAAWAEYAVLTLAEATFRTELRRVAFDLEAHLGAIRRSGLPNEDHWISAWSRASRLCSL
jgi:putative phosphoesterase